MNPSHVGGAARWVGDPPERNRERLRSRPDAKSRAAHADFGFDMREAEFGEESQARRPFVRGGRLERYLGVPPIDVQQIRQQRGAYALPAELGIDHETAREVAGERSASSTDARPPFPQLNQKA